MSKLVSNKLVSDITRVNRSDDTQVHQNYQNECTYTNKDNHAKSSDITSSSDSIKVKLWDKFINEFISFQRVSIIIGYALVIFIVFFMLFYLDKDAANILFDKIYSIIEVVKR